MVTEVRALTRRDPAAAGHCAADSDASTSAGSSQRAPQAAVSAQGMAEGCHQGPRARTSTSLGVLERGTG